MSDPYREQRPLLCDEYSDEEFHIRNYYQKRSQPSVCIGRARNHAKGAAAVLIRWPDNCSTSVAYWWLGVTMIAVTIFVIYNSVLIFGMIPASNVKQPKYRTFNTGIKTKTQTYSLPEVYMHLVVNNDSDLQLNNYLPHINHISTKYPGFNYNFLIVLNDTLNDVHDFNDDQRNEIAFNSLWANEKNARKISSKYNVSVEYISLSAYLNDSPIKKFWRHLPPHLIQFLIRSVSIWEKGGIAFNPMLLTSKSPNPKYFEKLYNLFNKYMNSTSKLVETKAKTKVYSRTNKKRPNNIRDIINALNADHNNISEIDLNEADRIDVILV
ncbi:uncharacterized protein [Epargyreus clarus]|uniref:uncharacterized protein n=1 Tax=Epargyreus clarus TaxID=520877 RepID=UPI003C2F313F